jgi:hypothetical protein
VSSRDVYVGIACARPSSHIAGLQEWTGSKRVLAVLPLPLFPTKFTHVTNANSSLRLGPTERLGVSEASITSVPHALSVKMQRHVSWLDVVEHASRLGSQ